jgi:N utilization substance protein A
MLNRRSDKLELLRIAESVANEKSIDKEIIVKAMETAIKKAAKTRFGSENEIRAIIDRDTGEINLHKVLVIVENPENLNIEISLKDAIEKEKKEDLKIGDEILEQLPPVDFGRIAAQAAKQVITQSVREAERDRQYSEFKDKVGEILGCHILTF